MYIYPMLNTVNLYIDYIAWEVTLAHLESLGWPSKAGHSPLAPIRQIHQDLWHFGRFHKRPCWAVTLRDSPTKMTKAMPFLLHYQGSKKMRYTWALGAYTCRERERYIYVSVWIFNSSWKSQLLNSTLRPTQHAQLHPEVGPDLAGAHGFWPGNMDSNT